jgi:hypothetical protein
MQGAVHVPDGARVQPAGLGVTPSLAPELGVQVSRRARSDWTSWVTSSATPVPTPALPR